MYILCRILCGFNSFAVISVRESHTDAGGNCQCKQVVTVGR